MPSRKKHTNPFLLLIAIALCLVLGVTLRQSTADFSVLEETSSSMTASSDSQKQDKTDSDQKEKPAPSATASPTPVQKPSDSNVRFLMKQLQACGLPAEATGSLW